MTLMPFVHEKRSEAQEVTFTDEHVIVALADGRMIGISLSHSPWLETASDAQRQNYELLGLSIYWEELDEGIDLTAMLTGMYIESSQD